MLDDYYRQYGLIAILALVAFIVPASMLMVSWLFCKVGMRPQKPEPQCITICTNQSLVNKNITIWYARCILITKTRVSWTNGTLGVNFCV